MIAYQDEYFYEIPESEWNDFLAELRSYDLNPEWINGLLEDFNYSYNGMKLGRISTMTEEEQNFMEDNFSWIYGAQLYTKSMQAGIVVP